MPTYFLLNVSEMASDRSMEAEVMRILEQSARADLAQVRQMVMEIRERLKGRKFPDSAELIREDRDR